MKLPDDITKSEMTSILHQLWKDYLPNEEATFIDQLDEEGLRFVFDVIGEKDEKKREQMRIKLGHEIIELQHSIEHIAQQANTFYLHYKEEKTLKPDKQEIEDIEQALESAF